MSKSRNEEIDLLKLPLDITTEALPRVIESDDDQIKVMAALSSTCHTLHNVFQPKLDVKRLLELILKPTKENLEKAKKMYCANPGLLFIESIGKEYAAGLDENFKNIHRVVKASPIRAMAGAGDIWLLKEVIETDAFKNYVDPVSKKSANELAADEIKKQFPDGFDFPPSKYHYDPLIAAITNDRLLIQHYILSDATKALLVEFRKHFLPDTVTSGHFFNLNHLVSAGEIYAENWSLDSSWSMTQLRFFWCEVIGYFQGLVTGVVGEVISQGILNVIDGNAPRRQYEFRNGVSGKKESYFPLAEDPRSRLGLYFGVDSDRVGFGREGAVEIGISNYKNLMSSNKSELERIYAALAATTAKPTFEFKR